MSARYFDQNDFILIKGNPISKVGVFDYSGQQIDQRGDMGLEPNRVYQVYRPAESLTDPACIDSFKLVPLIDDHVWLGRSEKGYTPAEEKGVQGVSTENVYFEAPYLKADLKIFSTTFVGDDKRKELSMGYLCEYIPETGEYNGKPYQFVQKNIRGNHVARVEEGRAGPDVAVLDHLKFTFDSTEIKKMQEKKVPGKDEGEVTVETLSEQIKQLMSAVVALSKSAAPAKTDKTAPILDDEEAEGENVSAETPEELQKVAEVTVESLSDQLDKLSAIISGIVEAKGSDDEEIMTTEDEEEDKDKADKKDVAKTGDRRVISRATVDSAVAASLRSHMVQIETRDKLAGELSHVVGTFDHSKMSSQEVAQYGLKRLGLRAPKGQEHATLSGYLAGKKSAGTSRVFGLDSSNIPSETSPFSDSVVNRGV